MEDQQSARDPEGKDARAAALDERLKAAKERESIRKQPRGNVESDASYRMGNRVLAELLGGIGGGAFVGWVIDQFAHTAPGGLLVMMAFGVVVAFRNIIRISNRRD